MKTGCLIVCVLFLGSTCIAQESKSQKTFPTNEEINLVVTQAARLFEQYKQSVDSETELPSAQLNKSSLDNDRHVVELSGQLIDALKRTPEQFNGLGGLLLLTTLDDASRNAALCSSSGMGDIGKELLQSKPDTGLGYRILSITQKCNDVSEHLYTVSESVNALLVRTMEAQQELNGQAIETLNQCTAAIKKADRRK